MKDPQTAIPARFDISRSLLRPCASRAWLALAALCALVPGAAGAQQHVNADGPRHLLLQVRDTPPGSPAAVQRGRDNSYTVGTGGGGARDDRPSSGTPDSSYTLSTANTIRTLRVLEGQAVRVDLPVLQSLQFHVPLPAQGAKSGVASSSTAPSTGAGSYGSGGSGAQVQGPAASGVVYFSSVSAVAARFALSGSTVHVTLQPLRSGNVAAPYAVAQEPASVQLQGRVGEWIALGDSELPPGSPSLSPTAEPPSPASVWVRVAPDPRDQP